ncbi:D-alanyl-D-alanine carboxypeptidase [Streptomyces sp. NP-1717]|uniref:D-alanyl-D-alanine carboxypeptidase n=1 Tax=Streptomyces sp. NP-1717 TaxID=2704470 RepID=UPI001F5D9CFD|nr:D-alanyl-D-alanine carboxypeptidase [Streptomyces sp. NP-1717]
MAGPTSAKPEAAPEAEGEPEAVPGGQAASGVEPGATSGRSADDAPAGSGDEPEAAPAGSTNGRAAAGGNASPAKPDAASEAGAASDAKGNATSAKPDSGSEAAPGASESAGGTKSESTAAGQTGRLTAAGAGASSAKPEAAAGGAEPEVAPAGQTGRLTAAGAGASSAKPGGASEAGVASGAKANASPAKPEAAPGASESAGGAKPEVAPAGSTNGRAAAGAGASSAKPGAASEAGASGVKADATSAKPESGSEAGADPGAEGDGTPAKPGSKPDGESGGKPGAAKSGGRSGVTFARAAGQDAGVTSAKPQTSPEGVDRQTAVFKAPARPGVDQPTAMLKLPPQPPAPAPESPAERTSKFVPLRSDEAQAPAQPAQNATPAPAPGAGVAEAERTRQQPMPPLPPLDLLAELTNKPAPPETPTRTVVRRVKIWTPLLVLVLIIFAIVQAVRPLPAPSLNLTAKSTYTFEGDKPALPWPGEGQGFMAATGLGTVDSFGEQKAVPIGSVAKAMTAYVVLKDKPLAKGAEGPSITVDAKAEEDGGLDAQGESTLNTVKEGDKLTQHDALAALMIPSANNIARLLARWNADGSEEAFVKKMNDTAEELGMKNTTYTDPSGLDATTVSSAEDQVKLGQKLVEIEALMDITKLPEWKDPSGKVWRNYNTLVPYDGALGIKTGSTTKAGGNLLFAAHKTVGDTDQLIVGAVLGQHRAPIIDTVNAVSKDVMLATQDELEGATVVKKGQVVGELDNGMGTTAPVVVTEDVKAVGWSGLTVKLELSDEGKDLPQSAAAGTHVGLLTVGEGKSRVEVPVALQGDLAEPTFGDKLTRVG